MREIKFRAWDTEAKLWRYFRLFDAMTGKLQQFYLFLNDANPYTGLKDKNGKEIYEGDIIKGRKGNYVVQWNDKLLQWDVEDAVMLWAFSYPEVIGNIYENPEALNTK